MQLLKVGAAVLNQTPLAWDSNKSHILAAIAAARAERVSLLCLPELCISGYGCEDAFLSPAVQRMAITLLGEILPATQGMIVSVGLPLLHNNCALQHGVPDRRSADCGIHGQAIFWRATASITSRGGSSRGRSDGGRPWRFKTKNTRWAIFISTSAASRSASRFAKTLGSRIGRAAELARRGVDVILNPSASHFAFAKAEVRHRFVLEGSRAFGVSYVYANLLGNEAGRAIYDGGALIASAGQLLAAGPRFSFAEFGVTTALVDIDATRMARARSGSFLPEFSDAEANCARIPFEYPQQEFEPTVDRHAAWETGASVKEEEFTRAIALALFDYLRKSRSRRLRRIDQRRSRFGRRVVLDRRDGPARHRRAGRGGIHESPRLHSRRLTAHRYPCPVDSSPA